MYNGKKTVSLSRWLESWTIDESVKLEHILTLHTKQIEWLKDVNKNHGAIKLLEEMQDSQSIFRK